METDLLSFASSEVQGEGVKDDAVSGVLQFGVDLKQIALIEDDVPFG